MKVRKLDHICIAVKDLEAARKVWEPVLGKAAPDDRYVDEPEKIRVARYWLDNVGFELMESTTPDGPVARLGRMLHDQPSIDRLLETGLYDDIQVSLEEMPGQANAQGLPKTRVIFRVKEKPVIKRVDFKGNLKLGDSKFRDEISLKAGEALDRFKVTQFFLGDIAEEAVRLIDIEWEPLPAYFMDPEGAVADGAPKILPDGNLGSQTIRDVGDPAKAFAAADITVEGRYSTQTLQHCPLEPPPWQYCRAALFLRTNRDMDPICLPSPRIRLLRARITGCHR